MKESILELKNICNGYNGVTVLKNINITFKKGEITSVIAPNGGGKTTLFKTACRLLKPASGEVLLDGKNIKEYVAKDLARRISLLPQFRPVPEMSVFDLVAQGRFPYLNLARRLSEEDKNIVNDAIIRVGIEALRDKSVELLSGGERQKAYIAMLIAQAADIVFLDEPTTFLDINHKLEVMNIIKELNKKGKTIVMILHDIGEALESSDMVCVMDKGEILCYDTPDRVFESRLIDRVFNVISQKIYVEGIGKHTFLFRNQKPFT